jgi:hypothetical protein
MHSVEERSGVAIVRVWLERSEGEAGLRARITLVKDLADGATEDAVASTPDEIVEIVRRFLDEILAG